MAADEAIGPPTSYDQSSLGVAGGVLADTPVSEAVPRNWRHSVAGAWPPTGTAADDSSRSRRSFRVLTLLDGEREDAAAVVDEQCPIRRDHRGVDGIAHVDF